MTLLCDAGMTPQAAVDKVLLDKVETDLSVLSPRQRTCGIFALLSSSRMVAVRANFAMP
jgi:hypothetical protein